ncbi:MAG: ethanolamine utilization protein EutH, partial [Oscillospiraceae bacterium]|nr:ethanolamine utilization protein EutH [Oscillospiraceae bacterium]
MPLFGASVSAWVDGLAINSVVVMIMMLFMLWGAIDKIMGNKFGYGEQW